MMLFISSIDFVLLFVTGECMIVIRMSTVVAVSSVMYTAYKAKI